MQKLLALVGPTAIGKTSLAIELAKQLNAEIVSGDSMQVYQEVAIGTAKATPAEKKAVQHYLVDSQSVFEPYAVTDFVDQAQVAIKQIAAKGKLPLLVGGTGFYVNALLNQFQMGEKKKQASAVADNWQQFYEKNGADQLWQKLNLLDQEAAAKIPPNNTRRVLRALTVIDRTGQKFSQQQDQIKPRYDYLIIGLTADRQEIYRRIDLRVDQMLQNGLLKEAEFVYQNRAREHQILQAIGFKEFFPYFEHQKSLAECVTNLKTASRHYAKRQLTYFRHQLPVSWFDPLNDQDCLNEITTKVKEWLHE